MPDLPSLARLPPTCTAGPYGSPWLACPAGGRPGPAPTSADLPPGSIPPQLILLTAVGLCVLGRAAVREIRHWHAVQPPGAPAAAPDTTFAAPAAQPASLRALAMMKIVERTAHAAPGRLREIEGHIPRSARGLLVRAHETAFHRALDQVLP